MILTDFALYWGKIYLRMTLTSSRHLIRWILIIASFVTISLILWKTYEFFLHFKEEERTKMEIWSLAQSEFQKTLLNDDASGLPLEVMKRNTSTPMIIVNKNGDIDHININKKRAEDSLPIKTLIVKFKKENKPIEFKDGDEILSTLYYGNSELLNKLKYYPVALILIIFLFSAVVYFFYKSTRVASQNKLWSGMAKETAHQIGTPLSSLIGWTEILKSERINPEYIVEIEKDINRLHIITERFSKIGSVPTLEKTDLIKETILSYEYLKTRSSKSVNFNIVVPNNSIFINLNPQLYSWAIENLVKNSIDAMKGKGDLTVEIILKEPYVKIRVTDTGKGISKQQFNSIFNPGYSTKKRGWGLGLSLTKRIVEDFHNGKIKVLKSGIDKGTTMEITLNLLN